MNRRIERVLSREGETRMALIKERAEGLRSPSRASFAHTNYTGDELHH